MHSEDERRPRRDNDERMDGTGTYGTGTDGPELRGFDAAQNRANRAGYRPL